MPVVRLKQRDLFTRRWRNVEALDPSELAIHIALVARLQRELRDDVIWYHVPNGEYRDKRSATKLKAMGLLSGAADLEFHSRRPTLFLEMKGPRGVLSPAQRQFKRRVEALGCKYATARSVDEAMVIIERHGLSKAYDPCADVEKSFDEAYRVIRERKARGGPGWTPK